MILSTWHKPLSDYVLINMYSNAFVNDKGTYRSIFNVPQFITVEYDP